jgi:pyruvate ferredoxin oxidoreductase gamma subunit
MFEVRFHGRGGQGIKKSAHLLAQIAFDSGYQTQDFAVYGAERRGAPVTSFTRFDKKPILERGYIFEPDLVIVLDESLNFKVMTKGLKSKGVIVINTKKKPKYFKKTYKIKQKIYCIDATEIALKTIGKPLMNTAMMGAAVKLVKLPFKALEKAVNEVFGKKGKEIVNKNIESAKIAAKLIK